MCVYSMIVDHYRDKWSQPPYTYPPLPPQQPERQQLTEEEIEDLRKLLERAKDYDKKNNEPDCETEEKVKKLKELAEELGATITFLDEK